MCNYVFVIVPLIIFPPLHTVSLGIRVVCFAHLYLQYLPQCLAHCWRSIYTLSESNLSFNREEIGPRQAEELAQQQ